MSKSLKKGAENEMKQELLGKKVDDSLESEQTRFKRKEQEFNEDVVELTWEDFNCNFLSECPKYEEVQEICEKNADRIIDLHPYMIHRPTRCFTKDTVKEVHEFFRHMNLRTLPVLAEDHSLVGIITRQDLFAYLSI